jgi:very-short-patch-repair endonuclease
MKQLEPNRVLVALMNNFADWAILHQQLWYRIPVESAPEIVRKDEIEYLAFYHSSEFEDEGLKWQIKTYGKVKRITQVSRQELFPTEPPGGKKAKKRYFKIELEGLKELSTPIVSTRGRRLVFVPTSKSKFFEAKNINTLFNDSPVEDFFYQQLQEKNISAERQWRVDVSEDKFYVVDFAIFCDNRNIAVECDGDRYHQDESQVKKDKKRDRELLKNGWFTVRYPAQEIVNYTNQTIANLEDIIKRNCSAEEPDSFKNYKPSRKKKDENQLSLFD